MLAHPHPPLGAGWEWLTPGAPLARAATIGCSRTAATRHPWHLVAELYHAARTAALELALLPALAMLAAAYGVVAMATAYGFDEAGTKRIVAAVRRIEQEVAGMRSRWGRTPAGTGRFFILIQTAGSLSAGSSVASNTVYEWTGSAWSSTSETVTVRDFRTSGTAIASGRRCICALLYGEWWVVATQC